MPSSVVQNARNICTAACGTTLVKAFTNNTVAGNICVVGVTFGAGSELTVDVTDSQGNTYTKRQGTFGATTGAYAAVFTATLGAGANTVTVTFGSSPSVSGLWIYEISGVTLTGITGSTGLVDTPAVAAPSATGSVTFLTGAFLFAVINSNVSSVTNGTGFTLDYDGSSGMAAEQATTGITSPTTFPFSWTGNANYAEAAVEVPASVAGGFNESGAKRQYRGGKRMR